MENVVSVRDPAAQIPVFQSLVADLLRHPPLPLQVLRVQVAYQLSRGLPHDSSLYSGNLS